jgi:hypothetical protein
MCKNNDNFEDMIRRVGIDAELRAAHKTKLRWRMLRAFNKVAQKQASRQMIRRKIMRSSITKFTIALTTAAVLIIVITVGIRRSNSNTTTEPGIGKPTPYSTPEPEPGPDMAPLNIKLPKPVFEVTPQDNRVANLEKLLDRPRPPLLVPIGTTNVALGKPVSSTDEEPIIGEIEMITDGDKEASDGSYVELGPLAQHVTIDLESLHNIYAVAIWHYHKEPLVYFDVVVQCADDRDFVTNVRTIFNNDIDNSLGLGVGKDKHYSETNKGKLIDAKGVKARYVRLYSSGNNNNDLNHYIEVEVYGKPVTDAPESVGDGAKPASVACKLVPLEIKLPRLSCTVCGPFNFRQLIPNLEQWPPQRRGPFLVPPGTTNVAFGKSVASTDNQPTIGALKMITDGDKEATDGSYVELGPAGLQSITIDLEAEHRIYAIVVWHRYFVPCAYYDIIVQVASGIESPGNFKTLFNNDHDNSAGLGFGKDKNYIETNQGKLIDAKGVTGRHVRLYSNGNDHNEFNHYIEVEVYGKPAQ